MTTTTSKLAGTLKAGLLALSLVAAGTGAASAHGFGGGGHMGGGFGGHIGGGGFHGGFHGGPAFHPGGYGGAPFMPYAFHAHNAYAHFRHYGYEPFFPDYAYAPYDIFGDVGPNCYDHVVRLGTHGHYRYVRENSCA